MQVAKWPKILGFILRRWGTLWGVSGEAALASPITVCHYGHFRLVAGEVVSIGDPNVAVALTSFMPTTVVLTERQDFLVSSLHIVG